MAENVLVTYSATIDVHVNTETGEVVRVVLDSQYDQTDVPVTWAEGGHIDLVPADRAEAARRIAKDADWPGIEHGY